MALLTKATAACVVCLVCLVLTTVTACGGRVQREEGVPLGASGPPKSDLAPTNGTGPLCIPSASASNDPLYVQKSFLIDPTGDNSGWYVTAQVAQTSPASPPMGMKWSGNANFVIQADTLQLVMSTGPMSAQVIDQWAITNVDVTAGSTCSPSQTQDWATSPWISWSFAKNNASDLELLNPTGQPWPPLLSCVEMAPVQASLVPGSFAIDENVPNSMSWRVQLVAQAACSGMATSSVSIELAISFFRL
jgi:hypothetical protein